MTPISNPDLGTERSRFYSAEALALVPRLLAMLDREPHSLSYGNFDRDNWAWKFRDFPLGMLQTAVYPLALVWRHDFPENPYHHNPRVLAWIEAAISQTLDRQHENGSFDAFCPNEMEPGVTVGVMHGLAEAYRALVPEMNGALVRRLLAAMRRAFDFAMLRNEEHGFINNHQALFAVGFLDAHEILGEEKYRARAEEIISGILKHQSREGWFLEYNGPDPGYETLGIHHLAIYWHRTGSVPLLDALRRAVGFFSHCVHPDGSVGGVYGSRHTSLYFPGGFEILSGEIPTALAIARFMRARLPKRNVLTSSVVDTENLVPLTANYLEAALAPEASTPVTITQLPCESLTGIREFADAGLVFAGSRRYYAAMHSRKGGVCRIFDRQSGRAAYEDSGYLIQAGGGQWTSQGVHVPIDGRPDDAAKVECGARFSSVQQEQITPWKFLVLRTLNLTLFRSLTVGTLLRKQIVARLILAQRPGPFTLRRTLILHENEVRIVDRLTMDRNIKIDRLTLERSFTPIHMGSAKYFHPAELEELRLPDVRDVARDLERNRSARLEFSLMFPMSGPIRMVEGEMTLHKTAAPAEAVPQK